MEMFKNVTFEMRETVYPLAVWLTGDGMILKDFLLSVTAKTFQKLFFIALKIGKFFGKIGGIKVV
ncbi:hypothetical protein ciss_01910 [Carboxydothermus islandicus]|uniref:Uncharacterized protein n=1 Tax=Carboxydothermus islandicus TaxID=661089 RepID=A0A1L8CZC3_9THEO|nr:hypothetical protein ciss_01910 [Carboxydothermus islandicus]